MILEWIFWVSVAVPLHAFVLYPLAVSIVARLSPVAVNAPAAGEPHPSVSIIIAAHDEEAHIGEKLRTLAGQAYPRDLVQILVASDGSTDQTVAVARSMSDLGVEVLDLPRQGKAAVLNMAVRQARGDILVFTDADNRWTPDTLACLMQPFGDPAVGAAGGHIEIAPSGRSLGVGDRVYRRFESWLRRMEARAGCLVSVDGAILAVRRTLFEPIPVDVTDDFFVSTVAPARGFRIGYAPGAIVVDQGLEGGGKQFRRRVRVTVRGLRSLWVRRSLMNPFVHGRYALAVISHKLLRRLAPVFMLPLAASCFLLAGTSPFFLALSVVGALFLVSALAGLADSRRRLPRVFQLAGFALVAVSGLAWGVVRFVAGDRMIRWTPANNR